MSLFNCYKFTFSAYIVFFLVFGFSTTPGWGDYATPSMPQFTMPEIKMPDNVKMPTYTFTFPTVNFSQMPQTSIFTNAAVNFPAKITISWTMPTYTFPTMPQLNIVFPQDVKLRLDRTFGPLSYSLFSSFPSASYSSSRLPGESYYLQPKISWGYVRQRSITIKSNIPLESNIPGAVYYKDLTTTELKRIESKW